MLTPPEDSSHIISSLLSSLIRICLASLGQIEGDSEATDARETSSKSGRAMSTLVEPPYAHSVVTHLISRLISFLKRARDEGRWDVASSALNRAASVTSRLSTWEGSTENRNMILALEGKIVPYPAPAQPMQWESSAVAHGHQSQQQITHQSMQPQLPRSASASSTSEPSVSAPSYAYSPSAQSMQHPSPSASTTSHHSQRIYNPVITQQPTANINVPRSPTPSHVPVLYPGQYMEELPAGAGAAAASATGQHLNTQGQGPTYIDNQSLQSLGSELDILGMDGVTFWTPWMSNVGIDGSGNLDEALSNYNNNHARPAGW